MGRCENNAGISAMLKRAGKKTELIAGVNIQLEYSVTGNKRTRRVNRHVRKRQRWNRRASKKHLIE
jgi:hypothetical protein